MTPLSTTRRRVLRGAGLLAGASALGIASTGTAAAQPGSPNLDAQLYGDGETWGTKGAALLPPPTDDNRQSYDGLFVVTNGAAGQLPVAEAAPGNPAYNGGRWITYTATWNADGMAAHDPLPALTRYGPAGAFDALLTHADLGHIDLVRGSPGGPGAPPDYFECPMLPDKS